MRRPLSLRTRDFDAIMRRAFDMVVALTALIIFAPFMLAIACAIKFDTPGPVLFSQIRVGRNDDRFRLYKFRKFAHRTYDGGYVTLRDDPRMTRVGRLLERTKLDELPQFWNVLVGDMSIVGPRPETLDFADCFAGPYRAVLDHKPGLFGPNQAIFRSENSLYPKDQDPQEFYRTVLFPAKARIDLSYFPQRTFVSDIGWTIRSGLAVFGLSFGLSAARAGLSGDASAAENLRQCSPSMPTPSGIAERTWHAR